MKMTLALIALSLMVGCAHKTLKPKNQNTFAKWPRFQHRAVKAERRMPASIGKELKELSKALKIHNGWKTYPIGQEVVKVSVSKIPTGEETSTTETAVYLRKNQYGYFFLSHYTGDSEMALEATEHETNVDILISAMVKDGVKKIQKLSETEFLVSTEYQDQSFATSCQTKMDVSKSLSLITTDCKDRDGNTYTSSLKSVKKVELSKYEGELKATKLRVRPNILNEFDEEVIDETEKDWSHLIK